MTYKNESIKANILTHIDNLTEYIKHNIPSAGDTSECCQQLNILNNLFEVECSVNGLTDNDF